MSKIKKTGFFILLLSAISIMVSYIILNTDKKREVYSERKETEADDEQLNNGENISKADIKRYKEILLEAATPREVLAGSSDEQIAFIAENLKSGEIYEAIDSFEFEDELIRITIICYSYQNNGEKQYKFFPSFRWLKTGYGIDNDSFGFAVYDGWEMVPDMPAKTKVCLKNSSKSKSVRIYDYDPIDASQYGYAYSFTDGISVPNCYYEGYGVFYARKKEVNDENEVSITYVHDNSSVLLDASYMLSIAPGEVSVSSDSSKLQIYSRVMTLNINIYE